MAGSTPAVVISKDLVRLVTKNFHLMRELQEHSAALIEQRLNKRSVEGILLGHFEDVTRQVMMLSLFSSYQILNSLLGAYRQWGKEYSLSFQNLQASEMEEWFYSSNWCKRPIHTENVSGLQAGFYAYINDAFKHGSNVLQKLGSWNNRNVSDDTSLEKITSWKLLFSSYAEDLQLDLVCKDLDKIISFAVSLHIQIY